MARVDTGCIVHKLTGSDAILFDQAVGDFFEVRAERGVVVMRELSRVLGLFHDAPTGKRTGNDEFLSGLMQLLIDLRNAAQKKAKARKEELSTGFERLFFKAIEENVLTDGKIDADEARWLKDMLFADGKIDENEKKFLARIKKAAKQTSPEFDALYDQCMKTK